MAELGDLLLGSAGSTKDVEVECLDYGYVDKCDDVDTLRSILFKLRSGKEGFYPHLVKHAEDKLLSLIPAKERAKVLRMRAEPTQLEVAEAETELQQWQSSICEVDAGLSGCSPAGLVPTIGSSSSSSSTRKSITKGGSLERAMPPVRGQRPAPGHGSSKTMAASAASAASAAAGGGSKGVDNPKETAPAEGPSRLSGYDFRAWDKFDVDGAVAQVDQEDEAQVHTMQNSMQQREQERRQQAQKRAHRREEKLAKLGEMLALPDLSGMERQVLAEREKRKGNESYKAGDAEESLAFYTKSLALDSTSAVVFANRAMAAIKLERLEQAEDDCSQAIDLDPAYVKAWTRRGMVRHKRGRYRQAMADFEHALQLNLPGDGGNQKSVEGLLAKTRAKWEEVEGERTGMKEISCRARGANVGADAGAAATAVALLRSAPALPAGTQRRLVASGQLRRLEREIAPPSEAAAAAAAATPPTAFRRIVVEEESDDDSDTEEAPEPTAVEMATWQRFQTEGQRRLREGDVPGALTAFSSALQEPLLSQQDTTSLKNAVGECYLRQARPVGAVEATSEVLQQGFNGEALMRRAEALQMLGCSVEAIADLKRILLEPRGSNSSTGVELRQTDAAERMLEKLLSRDEADEEASEALKGEGNAAMKEGRWDDAVCSYTKALLRSPGNVAAANNRCQAFLKKQDWRKAEQDATIVLCLAPDNAKALYRRGCARLRRAEAGQAVAGLALEDLVKAVACEPRNNAAQAELLKAQALCEGQEKGNAAATAAAAAAAVPRWEVTLVGKANGSWPGVTCAAQVSELERSKLQMEQGSGTPWYPHTPLVRHDCAPDREEEDSPVAKDSEEETPEGSSSCSLSGNASEETPEAPPQELKGFTRVAIMSEEEEEEEEEEGPGGELATSAPSSSDAVQQRAEAHKERGNTLVRDADLEGALAAYSACLELRPGLTSACNNRAMVLLKLGRPEECLADLELVLREEPTNVKALFRKGRALSLLEDKDEEAVGCFEAVLAVDPANQQARRELLQAVARVNKKKEQQASRAAAVPAPRAVSIPSVTPAAPTQAPKTLYELERNFRNLRAHPQMLAEYLKLFRGSTLKKVCKEATSAEVFTAMYSTIDTELAEREPKEAQRLLSGLSKVPCFGVIRMLMTEEDRAKLKGIFAQLARQGLRVATLEQAYELG